MSNQCGLTPRERPQYVITPQEEGIAMEHGNWSGNEKKTGGMAKVLNVGGVAANVAGNFIPGKCLYIHVIFIQNLITHHHLW